MISAVVFDLFGTLTGFETAREQQFVKVAAVLGVSPEALKAELLATYDERARGALGDVREQIVVLADRLGLSPAPGVIDEVVRLRMDGQRTLLQPRPGAIEMLITLRSRGIRIGILTDCTAETPKLWSGTEYAVLVDCAVFSCEIGARKPDKRMYEAVLSGLGVEASDVLYVGDGGSSELTGAARAGLHPIWLNVAGEDHFRYDEEVDWGGIRIGDLAAVLDLVEQTHDGAVS